MSEPLLVVVPNIGIAEDGDRLFMNIKAVEGCACYARYWPGRVRCLGRRTADANAIIYARWYTRDELPFEVAILSEKADGAEIAEHARDASVLMAGVDHHYDLGVVAAATVPVVMIIEYTLRTRLQTNAVSGAGLLKRLRTALWLLWMEWRRRRVLSQAAGVQANGVPAFDAYKRLNSSSLLYFDTRLRGGDLITGTEFDEKVATLQLRRPLRLAFSGRIERMKGADHLVPIARMLAERGIDFTFDIYGDGTLLDQMKEQAAGLPVRFHGPVDFDAALVPALKTSVDLFLCCHPQGDPSCTYLETLGCGVPIVGYLNEAWEGLLNLGPCGVGVPLGDDDAMVREIARLDADRGELCRLASGAVAVAAPRTFETGYEARVAHLRQVAERRAGSSI